MRISIGIYAPSRVRRPVIGVSCSKPHWGETLSSAEETSIRGHRRRHRAYSLIHMIAHFNMIAP